ncbi:TPA: PilZ domain-containing protein, partial [Candidatus Micrarchaeota archaeon]|nr:PilZ domain-containing protein [Candidatus Micrarchaeota archaeon]
MSQERREYFRIEDTAAVEYVAVTEVDMRTREADEFFSATQSFQLLSHLQEIDHEANKLLHGLRDTQRELAGYLKLVNKKTDLLAVAVLQLGGEARHRPQEISLSAGGMSFAAQEKYAKGDLLALRFQLVNDTLVICCFGRIVYCGANENGHGPVTVAIEFQKMPGSAQTLLARHIMRCQQALQRRKLDRKSTR